MKTRFILNPASGNGKTGRRLDALMEFFIAKTGHFDCVSSISAADIEKKTRQALKEGVDQIVAIGGDGTIHAVANGFFENGVPIRPEALLAIGAEGTASDYFRGLTRSASQKDWREIVLEHAVKPVDLGRIRFLSSSGETIRERVFVNMAGVGMSAEVAKKKQELPNWIPSALSYAIPTLKMMPTYKPTPARITIDSEVIDTKLMGIIIAKGTYAGGGMRLGGGVDLDDGLFDATLFGDMSVPEMIFKFGKLYTGAFRGEDKIKKFAAKSIRVESEAKILVESDGESLGQAPVEFTVLPKAIRLCVPK